MTTDLAGSCGTTQWYVLGTARVPQLYIYVDDLDTGAIYALTKRR